MLRKLTTYLVLSIGVAGMLFTSGCWFGAKHIPKDEVENEEIHVTGGIAPPPPDVTDDGESSDCGDKEQPDKTDK